MTQLTESIWIGDSSITWRTVRSAKIGAVLNVAQDLKGDLGWPNVEYMQVGLIDGPGNPTASYIAAVLALSSLLERHRRVLVCCHTGSRSVVVAMMLLNITANHDWNGLLVLLKERVDTELPVPHEAHKIAFDNMNWELLASLRQC